MFVWKTKEGSSMYAIIEELETIDHISKEHILYDQQTETIKRSFLQKAVRIRYIERSTLLEQWQAFTMQFITLFDFSDVHVEATLMEKTYYICVHTPDGNILIGHNGHVLRAIQFLFQSLYKRYFPNDSYRVLFDVNHYQKRMIKRLTYYAHRMAEQVTKKRRSMVLERMNAYQRHIIHDALRENPHVFTKSVGEGNERRIVLHYQK